MLVIPGEHLRSLVNSETDDDDDGTIKNMSQYSSIQPLHKSSNILKLESVIAQTTKNPSP